MAAVPDTPTFTNRATAFGTSRCSGSTGIQPRIRVGAVRCRRFGATRSHAAQPFRAACGSRSVSDAAARHSRVQGFFDSVSSANRHLSSKSELLPPIRANQALQHFAHCLRFVPPPLPGGKSQGKAKHHHLTSGHFIWCQQGSEQIIDVDCFPPPF